MQHAYLYIIYKTSLSVAWSFGVQPGFFFLPGISVVFTPQGSQSVIVHFFYRGIISNSPLSYLYLFVSCVDSLIGLETFMRTKCFEPLEKQRARVWIQ